MNNTDFRGQVHEMATSTTPRDRRTNTEQGELISDESVLIDRARTCPEAFGQLFDIYYERILNYLFRNTLDLDTAEELTSSTFFNAFRSLHKYTDRGLFRAWLYRIATNELRMHYRATRGQIKQVSISNAQFERICITRPASPTAEDSAQALETFSKLHQAISRLPARYRTVIELRYFEELSYNEIAEVLGKRVGTVKSLVHRALVRLKTHF